MKACGGLRPAGPHSREGPFSSVAQPYQMAMHLAYGSFLDDAVFARTPACHLAYLPD